tara:strand:+ start:1330 stop:1485 length:156 start_codon:yes stop_codon:yes gene_type:complete
MLYLQHAIVARFAPGMVANVGEYTIRLDVTYRARGHILIIKKSENTRKKLF